MSFGKIFESTFTGSMVGAGPTVFAVWAYVIANTRPPGEVEINPVILAAILGTSVDDIDASLTVLTSPDERSRTKLFDGRRLVKTGEFSYEVPTWLQYRNSRNDEERKAYNREAQRKHREKRTSNGASMTCQASKPRSAQAEDRRQKTEAEAFQPKEPAFPPVAPLLEEFSLECPKPPKKTKPAKSEESSDHAEFIALWTDAYPKHHSGNAYAMNGARDGKAVKELLKATKESIEDLIGIAVRAWKNRDKFHCKNAATLHGFQNKFNEIRDEVGPQEPARVYWTPPNAENLPSFGDGLRDNFIKTFGDNPMAKNIIARMEEISAEKKL